MNLNVLGEWNLKINYPKLRSPVPPHGRFSNTPGGQDSANLTATSGNGLKTYEIFLLLRVSSR